MSYPRGVKPNYALDDANLFAALLGAPVVADVDRVVVSANMKVGAYTIANAASADALARNVTVTQTAVDTEDTNGTIVVVGTDVTGRAITETITPNAGATVAGVKAFKTVTSVTGVGWVQGGTGPDTITVGFGNLIGLPAAIRQAPAVAAAAQVIAVLLGTAFVAVTATIDTDELEKCVIDASAGTYDGSKKLVALIAR